MHLPSTTSLLPHFSWLVHLLIGYQKLFQTNHSKPYISKESKQNATHIQVDFRIQTTVPEPIAARFG
jgi:hypothetical protein